MTAEATTVPATATRSTIASLGVDRADRRRPTAQVSAGDRQRPTTRDRARPSCRRRRPRSPPRRRLTSTVSVTSAATAYATGEREREPGDPERREQHEREPDVDRVLEAVERGTGCACPAASRSRAGRRGTRRTNGRPTAKPTSVSATRRGVVRPRTRRAASSATTIGRRAPTYRPRGRDHDGEDQPEAAREPVAQRRRGRRAPTADASSGCDRGHDRHREQAVRELEERERAEVDERAAVLAVGEHEHDPERDLVRDRRTRPSSPRAAAWCGPRRGASARTEAQPDAGAPQRGPQHERHRGDARRRPEPEQQQRARVVRGPARP